MKTAYCIVAHGSKLPMAQESFTTLTARVAARTRDAAVTHAFLQFAQPSVEEAVKHLQTQGADEIRLLPYFLADGKHVSEDLPALAEALSTTDCRVCCLPSLENDPLLEDLLVDRVAEAAMDPEALPQLGQAIEQTSHAIIDARLATSHWQAPASEVVRRVIHSTADFTFAETMRLHPEAVAAGIAALRAGKPILCDSTILLSGITRTDSALRCVIREDAVRQRATAEGTTRAVAAMRALAPEMDGAIVAIGNAPTALFEVIRLAQAGLAHPALVVGLPVGFVGARESKLALIDSGLTYIANTTPRGGSPAAAAAVNALAILARAE